MPLNCKMVKTVYFMLCVLEHTHTQTWPKAAWNQSGYQAGNMWVWTVNGNYDDNLQNRQSSRKEKLGTLAIRTNHREPWDNSSFIWFNLRQSLLKDKALYVTFHKDFCHCWCWRDPTLLSWLWKGDLQKSLSLERRRLTERTTERTLVGCSPLARPAPF